MAVVGGGVLARIFMAEKSVCVSSLEVGRGCGVGGSGFEAGDVEEEAGNSKLHFRWKDRWELRRGRREEECGRKGGRRLHRRVRRRKVLGAFIMEDERNGGSYLKIN